MDQFEIPKAGFASPVAVLVFAVIVFGLNFLAYTVMGSATLSFVLILCAVALFVLGLAWLMWRWVKPMVAR